MTDQEALELERWLRTLPDGLLYGQLTEAEFRCSIVTREVKRREAQRALEEN